MSSGVSTLRSYVRSLRRKAGREVTKIVHSAIGFPDRALRGGVSGLPPTLKIQLLFRRGRASGEWRKDGWSREPGRPKSGAGGAEAEEESRRHRFDFGEHPSSSFASSSVVISRIRQTDAAVTCGARRQSQAFSGEAWSVPPYVIRRVVSGFISNFLHIAAMNRLRPRT